MGLLGLLQNKINLLVKEIFPSMCKYTTGNIFTLTLTAFLLLKAATIKDSW